MHTSEMGKPSCYLTNDFAINQKYCIPMVKQPENKFTFSSKPILICNDKMVLITVSYAKNWYYFTLQIDRKGIESDNK